MVKYFLRKFGISLKIMSHSFHKILIHAIWSTKNRAAFIWPEIEAAVYQFMKEQFTNQDCLPLIINGIPDHVHCLFFLNPAKSIAEVIKQVKGSTSHYINQQNFMTEKFSWQTGYAAFSVSESVKNKIFEYIKNQKAHHRKITFEQEYQDFLALYKPQF